MTSRAVSTEDLFRLPVTLQQVFTRPDSTYTDWHEGESVGEGGGGGTSCAFPVQNERLPVCHFSDTDMAPLSSRLLPAVPGASTSSTCPHPRRCVNRLKRRRRAFGGRFYTFDSRFLSSQQNVLSNHFESSQHN